MALEGNAKLRFAPELHARLLAPFLLGGGGPSKRGGDLQEVRITTCVMAHCKHTRKSSRAK